VELFGRRGGRAGNEQRRAAGEDGGTRQAHMILRWLNDGKNFIRRS
jgi:hypothetical protein